MSNTPAFENTIGFAEQALANLGENTPRSCIDDVIRLRETLQNFPGPMNETVKQAIGRCDKVIQQASELRVI